MTCLGSATVSPGLSTTLLDHVANQAHYRLGLVRIRPLGHIHGGGSRGAPGLLFEFHWHLVLPCLPFRGAHYLLRLRHLLHPRNLLPPLLWLQSGIIRVH